MTSFRLPVRLFILMIFVFQAFSSQAIANPPTVQEAASRSAGLAPGQSIVEQHPSLKSFLFVEPKSSLYFGFGLNPVTVMKSRVGGSLSFFQLHYIKHRLDFEVFNASFGAAVSKDSSANSSQFLFRTAPKIRIFPGFSVGPMVGLEYISFASIDARLTRARFFSPFEPFSTHGFVLGAMASQLVALGNDRFLRINEVAYQQHYSVTKAGAGWEYEFRSPSLQADAERTLIKPGNVFALEFSLLF